MLLTDRGLVSSRTKAQALVMAGQVKANGELVKKMGTTVPVDAQIELIAGPKYVSRGGEKLEGALDDFQLSPEGCVCLDVGASTGGFTDCLLQRGAKKVYAVDVGHGQLDMSLRNDPRVVCMEKAHILNLDRTVFTETPTLAVIDVSFISIKSVLAHVRKLLPPGSIVLPMIKPQFEVGAKNLKKGVVRSDSVRTAAVEDLVTFAKGEGFLYLNQTPAKLKGPKGNQEYFFHLTT